MRSHLFRVLTNVCRLVVVAVLASPNPIQADPPPGDPAPLPLAGVTIPEPKVWTDADYAGLPPGSHPEVLTWERAYTLALIRFRSSQPARGRALAETLDPKSLAAQAERLGVGDFERFRKDFFAERKAGGSFVDPSGSLFDLLGRLQWLENAKSMVDSLDALKRLFQELTRGEASGLSQLDLDGIDLPLQKARRRFLEELRDYRDRLDELKVELGLSPHAPIVLDRTSLARFRAMFDKADAWGRDPARKLEELPGLVAELPALEDVVLDHVVLNTVPGGVDENPGRLEEVLRAAEQAATEPQRQGETDDELRLKVRRRVRALFETRYAYEVEKRGLLLALRIKDQAFEKIIAPPVEPAQTRAPQQVGNLLAMQAQLFASEDQLVTLWASYHAERLALARDLRVLPAHDWKSFYSQITGEPAADPAPGNAPPSRTPPPPRKVTSQ